jgi:two-component system response regulator DevR
MENTPEVRVLIVDDHDMVRKGIKSWLDAEVGITVVAEVNRGMDAIARILEVKPDVVILDLHLPDKHGLEIIRELRASKNDTPILVMSGYERQRARSVLEAGANGFLNKLEKRERFIDAVHWAAAREPGTWLSPTTASELMQSDSAIRNAELTKTELKVLSLIEHTNTEIAEKLFLSESTVKNHVTSLYSKLNVSNRFAAVAWAKKHGVIESAS